MAIVIKPNGETTEAFPQNKRTGFDLEELYALIGCDCIDVVIIGSGERMVVDDEACYKTLEQSPPNQKASTLYWTSRPSTTPFKQFIRGTVLVGNAREIQ